MSALIASRFFVRASLLAALLLAAAREPARGLDRVTLRRDGREERVAGKLLVTAADGGLLLLAADGVLWRVPPEELVEHKSDDEPFTPLSSAELAEKLLAKLPTGFVTQATAHYLICHNTSRAYAQWCGSLLERLYMAFTNYWTRKGFALREPEFPLVALVFADQQSYRDFARAELKEASDQVIGYYSLETNRINMYDLTGSAALRHAGDRHSTAAGINQILSRPEAERTVATIIHEATHQIAFNCGLQARYADVPLWVSEGLAVYFETPDLSSAKGWRNIGAVNLSRLRQFRQYLAQRPANSLETLIADDQRMRDPRQAADAYAEAWAFNYFLIQRRPAEYHAYLKQLAAKPPLVWDDRETRLAEFKQAFGHDLTTLDAEFLRQMSKLR